MSYIHFFLAFSINEVNMCWSLQRRFPDVTAVSCGAILSNYQRFRVEDVCSRLGLVPLDYLWQRDRRSLLNEMVEHGVHAVLVKVSGGGLDPLKHLGRDLAALVPTFERLHDRFGLDICGEGGEYETMVLDMPMFKQRIEILESEVVCDGNDISVGHLRIHSFRVVPKIEGAGDGIRASNIWIDECLDTAVPCSRSGPLRALPSAIAKTAPPCSAPPSVDGLGCTSLLIPDVSPAVPTEERVEKQIESLMIQLSAIMEHFGGAIADACFVHLYVSDMSNFGAVNSAYSKYFGRNPPSRSCIAVSLVARLCLHLGLFRIDSIDFPLFL
jgi:diphthine-ammonia ligase